MAVKDILTRISSGVAGRLRAVGPATVRLRRLIAERRREIVTIGGYIFYGLVFFFFFVYLTFPFQELRGRVESFLERTLTASVEIRSIEPSFLPGLILRGVTVSAVPGAEAAPLHIDALRFRMGFLPLLWRTHTFSARGSLYGGKGRGRVTYRANFLGIDAEISGIRMGQMDYIEKRWGITLKGVLSAGFRLAGSPVNASQYKGRAYVRLDKGGVGESSFMGLFKLPTIDFDDAHGNVVISAGRGVLDDVVVKGKDAEVQLTGDIILQNVIGQSILNLKGKFKISDAVAGSLSTILPYMNLQKDAQGYYLFSVTGSLSAPWVKN